MGADPRRAPVHATGIACEGRDPWFSLHGAVSRDTKGGGWANRALVVRKWSSRLGGRDVPRPFASVFGTENGVPSANVELSSPPGLTSLLPGDFVEAEVDLVVFPVSAESYYGPNTALTQALRIGGDTWRMARREAVGNAVNVEAARGRLVRATIPVEVAVNEQGHAEILLSGGLGYVPLTFSGLDRHRGIELWRDDGNGQGPRRIDQSVHGRDFWQSSYDPASKTWSLTYNVPVNTRMTARPFVSACDGRRIEFLQWFETARSRTLSCDRSKFGRSWWSEGLGIWRRFD